MPVVFTGYNQIPYVYVPPGAFSVEYLVVGGGGGGGRSIGALNRSGGGGGAGGFQTGTLSDIIVGTSYNVEVGAGGPGNIGTGLNTDDPNQRRGGNSTFSIITSLGGGGGGGGGAAPGGAGGSGGGAGRNSIVFGTGTPGQGNDGGAGFTGTANTSGAGGGGGAGATGSNGISGAGGNGGDGLSSSITGSTVFYAGGGGGGVTGTGGTGGNGGGGAGASAAGNGNPGITNTGGGGGGATSDIAGNGGDGGSGIVILKYPNNYLMNTSVGLTYSESVLGSFYVTSFTSGTGTVEWTKKLIQLSYITAVEDLTNLTTYTFNNVNLGSSVLGANTRYVIIVASVSGISANTISNLTVDGSSATMLMESSTTVAGSNESHHRVYSVQDNAKTTANVVVTNTGGKGRCYLSVYNLINPANVTPSITSNTPLYTTSVNSLFNLIDVSVDDVILTFATSDARTFTWTGATENNESTSEAGSPVVSHANTKITSVNASYNVGVTYSAAGVNAKLFTLKWGT